MTLLLTARVGLLTVATVTTANARPAGHTLHDFKAKRIDGHEVNLKDYKGKVVLVVNTALQCGFTPQYEALEAIYKQYGSRGFTVLAFPANDFGAQEPGTNDEIQTFCSTKYATTFPLFAKITVKGDRLHPLYAWLTKDAGFPGDIRWNFTKFLIGPDGHVAARFDSAIKPDAPEVTAAIEKLLAAK